MNALMFLLVVYPHREVKKLSDRIGCVQFCKDFMIRMQNF